MKSRLITTLTIIIAEYVELARSFSVLPKYLIIITTPPTAKRPDTPLRKPDNGLNSATPATASEPMALLAIRLSMEYQVSLQLVE